MMPNRFYIPYKQEQVDEMFNWVHRKMKEEKGIQNRNYRDEIIEILNKHLGDVLVCTRVWEAWSYGTMTECDFESLPDENIEDIATDIENLFFKMR